MIDGYQSYEDVQAQLVAFFADPGEEEQAMLKAREDYYRKRLAARPKPAPEPEPAPAEKPKYRKPRRTKHRKATRRNIRQLVPEDIDSCADDIQDWRGDCSSSNPDETFYLGLMAALRKSIVFGRLPDLFQADSQVIEAAQCRPGRRQDARDKIWDGYGWECI